MDLKTIYETNFTVFIGIFVTLAVMGTTTLYDRYKSKGGASFNFEEAKLFSDLNQKIKTLSSEGLKHFSEYSKKLISISQKKSGSSRKRSSSVLKKSSSIQRNSGKNNPVKVETIVEKAEPIFLKSKDNIQKLFDNLSKKISSLSSALPRKTKHDKERFVSLADKKENDSKFLSTDKVNNLDKVVKSKRDELDFDDDLLTEMSTASTLKSNSPEANTAEPFFGEMSSEIDTSSDNDLIFNENEFEIKIEGLDNEPVEDNFLFNDNSAEIKFGDESDSLLASLKNDIVVSKEKKINFMDNMQGEDLDLKLMKSDLEGILRDLKKYRRGSKS
jgi:hypothetical protein